MKIETTMLFLFLYKLTIFFKYVIIYDVLKGEGIMDLDYYTAVLYKQFCETKGLECCYEELIRGEADSSIVEGFNSWINSDLPLSYRDYLLNLNYHNLSHAVEINKGKNDTITIDTPIRRVSPFNYTFGENNSKLCIVDGIIFIEESNKLTSPEEKLVLISHNPYDNSILKWPMIQKRKEHDLSIGFYGLKTDENFKDRIELAKLLLKKMDSDCELDYEFDRDKYFISLNSRSKKLRLQK